MKRIQKPTTAKINNVLPSNEPRSQPGTRTAARMHETHCCKNTMGLVQNNTELSRNQKTTSRQTQFTGPGYKRATRALQNRCTALCRNAIFLESSVGLSVEWVRKPSRVENQGGGGGEGPDFLLPSPSAIPHRLAALLVRIRNGLPRYPPHRAILRICGGIRLQR